MYILWSKKEIELLRKYYPVTRVKDLVKMFPERHKGTIAVKAKSLKLPSAKLWQPNENKILLRYFSELTVQELLKLLPRRSKTAIWAQGERLGLKQNRNRPRLNVNENYFEKWSSDMAYILGFTLADGCIIEGTYKGYSGALKYGVHKKDVDILEKIKQKLESDHKISFSTHDAVHFCISSQKIVEDLKFLGISYRKSLHENIPNVPKKYIKDFIRGIVDGDGSISFGKSNYPTLSVCGGENTINFIQKHFFSKFNIYSKISTRKKYEKSQPIFYIAYRANSAKTLIYYLYNASTIYLERKFKLAKRSFDAKIRHKEKNYTEEEEKTLQDFYKISSKNKILSLFPERTWNGIQGKARELKMYKYNIKIKK